MDTVHTFSVCPKKDLEPNCGNCKSWGRDSRHNIRSNDCPECMRIMVNYLNRICYD